MKKTARILAVLLAFALLFALAACGSSGPEGKYVVKTIDGQSVDEAVEAAAKAANMSKDEFIKQMGIENIEEIVTLELKSDKTAIMETKMFSYKGEGTWKQDGDKISITIEGDTSDFTLKGNELSNVTGEQKYVLIKK